MRAGSTPLLLLVAFVLLLLVLVPGLRPAINGARRWLGAGPLQFQPSEIMKLALVMHAAAVLSARPKIARSLRTVAGPILGVGGCAVLLIMAQPDLGTALVDQLHAGARCWSRPACRSASSGSSPASARS